MGLMYEVPSFGRAYFDGDTPEKPVVVGIGAKGVQFLDASDGNRPVLVEYGFESIASFVCSDEVYHIPNTCFFTVKRVAAHVFFCFPVTVCIRFTKHLKLLS